MMRFYSIALTATLLAGSAFAAVVENGALRVELDETSGSLTVVDKRTSRTWKSIADDHPIVVSDVQAVGSRITFKGTADSVKGSLAGEVALDGEKVLCSLDAPETTAFALGNENLVGWPTGFVAEKGDRFLLPHGSGFSFPAEQTDMGARFEHRMYGYSRAWRMGLWAQYTERLADDGEILGAGGYMAVVETPCNAVGFYGKRANGLMGFSCLWENDLGTWGHRRQIRFEFMTDCSPMAVALRYRDEMKRKGYYKTFAEKAKERPKMAESFRRLSGSPSVWYWEIDGDKAGVCRYLREKCGFTDFLFQFARRKDLGVWITPEEVKACSEAAPGVLLSEYDMYLDTMERKYLPLIEYVRPYWSLDAADNDDIVYNADGKPVRGWKVALKGDADGMGKGIGCAAICEKTVCGYVRKGLSAAMSKCPWYTGRYLDGMGCLRPAECYHARHRMSRRESVEMRRKMLAIPGDEYGLLSSTEDGQDFLASVCDYFTCGFSASNDYRVDGGRWMWKIYDGEPPDEIRRGTDEKTRMPIFEMVFHGCMVSYWDWCDYNFKFPTIWWKRDLFNALCGTPPLYFFNEETWKRFRDQLKASYDVTTPVAKATYSVPIKAYRILTPDRAVHRVEFENGVASTVNFGDKPFTMKDGRILPPRGFLFDGLQKTLERSPAPVYKDPIPAVEVVPRKGIGNFLGKVRSGKPVTVAYLGGSITSQGDSRTGKGGWRVKTTKWLREQYPQAKITEVDAAIGGTGSSLGVFRLDNDVLRHDPDLLFVEFACNDGADGGKPEMIWRAMDGIVRQTWRKDPLTDIVFAYTVTVLTTNMYAKGVRPRPAGCDEMLADHYGIPSIDFGPRVWKAVAENRLMMTGKEIETAVPKEDPEHDRKVREMFANDPRVLFSNDGVHPRDEGHDFYLESVKAGFAAMEGMPPVDHGKSLDVPFVADNMENAKMVDVQPSMLTGDWATLPCGVEKYDALRKFSDRFGDAIHIARKPGTKLSFRFKGTECWIYNLVGPDCAQLWITVDGKRQDKPAALFDRYCTYYRIRPLGVFSGMDGVHDVEIEVDSVQPSRQAVAFRLKNPDVELKEEKYNGTAWIVGKIMLVGDIVK